MYLRLSYFCVTAKRKLGISNDENITIYTEADGTELNVTTANPGTINTVLA